jgi:hypothetical protein
VNAPTHATLATFRVDPARETDQRSGLEEFIVPGVRRHPGLVSGTWTLDRESATSLVMLTYDSVESARAMRDNIVGNAAAQRSVGLDLVAVRILEVTASTVLDA